MSININDIVTVLEDQKAQNIDVINVSHLTSLTDVMLICTARSTTHAKAISDYVCRHSKKIGHRPISIEGEHEAEWILIDLSDCVVHVMLSQTREFYSLEKLWKITKDHRST